MHQDGRRRLLIQSVSDAWLEFQPGLEQSGEIRHGLHRFPLAPVQSDAGTASSTGEWIAGPLA